MIGGVEVSPLEGYEYKNSVWVITSLKVHYKYRRLGLGEKLIKKVLDHLNKIGADEARLYVSPLNIPAVKLYNKLGFTVTRDTTNKPVFKEFIYLRKDVKDPSCHTSQIRN